MRKKNRNNLKQINMNTLSGRLIVKNESKQITDTFTKRDFVIETDEKYPQKIIIELTQDKCKILDEFNVGDLLEVKINVRGREWTSPKDEVKYFNSIHAWDIVKLIVEEEALEVTQEKDDDLPF